MANVTVTTTKPVVNVNSTTNTVNVSSTTSNIVVSNVAQLSNTQVRAAISVTDTGGDGSLTYSSANGVFTYTGPSQAEVLAHFSNVSPINLEANGQISVDEDAIFSSKTTDDLAEGNVNLYFTDARAISAVGNSFVYFSTNASITPNTLSYTDGGVTKQANTHVGQSSLKTGTGTPLIENQYYLDGGTPGYLTGFTSTRSSDESGATFGSFTQAATGTSADADVIAFTNDLQFLKHDWDFSNSRGALTTLGELTNTGSLALLGGVKLDGTTNYVDNDYRLVVTDLGDSKALSVSGNVLYEYPVGSIDRTHDWRIRTNESLGRGTWDLFSITGNITSGYTLSLDTLPISSDSVISTSNTISFGNSVNQTHTFTGNVDVTGNVTVTGNLNYQNVTDLYVTDQKITLNANAATDATVEIIANRPVAGSNTVIRWNETSDIWEFTNDGSTYYPIPTSTSDLAEGTNLYFTTDRANSAIGAYQGNIDTAGNITAQYFFANEEFIGDLEGAISEKGYNNTGSILSKGDAVYVNGYQGDQPNIALANSQSAAHMPAVGIVKEDIGIGATGQFVVSGVMNYAGHGFTAGDELYVNGAGVLQTTPPTGEANLIQKIGKALGPNHILVQGAGRTNATPNLDDGKFFLGNAANQAATAVFTDESNTAFDARNLDSSSRKLIDNVWVKDFGITDNLAGGGPNYYFPNGSPGSAGQFLLTTGADQLGFSDFTDESNTAIADYLIDTGTQKKAHTVFVQDLALSPDAANATLGFYMPNGQGTAGQVLKFDSATQLTQAFIDTANVTETTNLFYTDARVQSNTAADTGLVHTTGTETIGGDKTLTDLIQVIPSANFKGLEIHNDLSSIPFLFQSNVASGVRQIWQQSNDNFDGGDIIAYKSRGNVASTAATEYGDQVFTFEPRPHTSDNYKEGVRFGFDVEHGAPGSGKGNGAVTTAFENAKYGKDFATTKLLHTSTGSFRIGPGKVDINPLQFRNRGNTIIGNGGDTEYVSFDDYEAKLIFDRSNVSSSSNVNVQIMGVSSFYYFLLGGVFTGNYGWGPSATIPNYDIVCVAIAGADEINGGYDEAGGLPDGLAVTIQGNPQTGTYMANAVSNTYYIKKFYNDDDVVGDGFEQMWYILYTDAALTSPLHGASLDPNAPGAGAGYPWIFVYAPELPGGYMEYGTKPAQGNIFVDSFTTTGSGTGSAFQVNRYNGSYNTVGFSTPSAGLGGPYTPNPGSGHAVGDTITISGADLKGIATTNDCTFTVDSVDGGGGITSIGNLSGTAYQLTNKQWSLEMDQTSDNLTLYSDGVEKVQFTGTQTEFLTIPKLPQHANTSLPGTTTAGMIFVTGGNNAPAYSDGTNWRYFSNDAIVT